MSLRPHALLTTLFLMAPGESFAQTFHVELDERARRLLGPRLASVEDQIEGEIGRQMQALVGTELAGFLRLSANSQALVHKGLGTDYASAPDGLILGVSGAAATNTGDTKLVVIGSEQTEVPVGVGAQATLMVGYNFASVGVPELTLFLHGGGAPLSFSKFDGSFYNFGATAQYALLGPQGSKWPLEWGGLRITSGVEVSRMKLTVAALEMDDIDVSIGGVRLRGESDGHVTLDQHAISIPLELTSAVTMLYALTVYAGVAVDFDFGGANLLLDLDTTLTADGASESGNARASLEDAADPDHVVFRVLAGAQLNLGPVHLFAQLNVLPVSETMALAAGLRVAF